MKNCSKNYNDESIFAIGEKYAKKVLDAKENYDTLLKRRDEVCKKAAEYAKTFQTEINDIKNDIDNASKALTEASVEYNNFYDENVEFFESFGDGEEDECVDDASTVTVVDESGKCMCKLTASWKGNVTEDQWDDLYVRLYKHLERYM